MAASSLSRNTLKYITSVGFKLTPSSTSHSTKTLRLLLGTMPFKPSASTPDVPKTSVDTVATPAEQGLNVTYSDKKQQFYLVEGASVADLIRKIEAPAKALRAKAEGL